MIRRTKAEWNQIIKSWKDSGLSQTKYCQLNNLNYWSFRENRLKREPLKGKNKLVRISRPEQVVNINTTEKILKHSDLQPKHITQITVILADGIQLKIPEHFNEETFQNIMNVLGKLQ